MLAQSRVVGDVEATYRRPKLSPGMESQDLRIRKDRGKAVSSGSL